ncbi:hypothetical protein PR048_005626, partial [Dryococelus australis]
MQDRRISELTSQFKALENINEKFSFLDGAWIQIFLTLPVSVASKERSLRKLKLTKNFLRITMKRQMLPNLSIISIENKPASS